MSLDAKFQSMTTHHLSWCHMAFDLLVKHGQFSNVSEEILLKPNATCRYVEGTTHKCLFTLQSRSMLDSQPNI